MSTVAPAGTTSHTRSTEPRHASVALRNVSRWYGNVVAVNDISFELTPGVTGLLGPNGAGKTTLLHMMAGFLAPSAGMVTVNGAAAWKNPDVYRHIGIVPEREDVYPFLTGREFVRMNALLHDVPDPDAATARAIHAVDLMAASDRRIGTYSKGMRQRIKVAAALVHDPAILLLDEPFNGMDPKQRLHMIDMLRADAARGRIIVFSTHILEELHHVAEQVLVVVAGRLAASGDFREIRRLMTDRPHTFTLHSTDNRRLAAALVADDSVGAVDLAGGQLTVRALDRGSFTRALPRLSRQCCVSLRGVIPADESLESVFSYLVAR